MLHFSDQSHWGMVGAFCPTAPPGDPFPWQLPKNHMLASSSSFEIEVGRGGFYLHLTPGQYAVLRRPEPPGHKTKKGKGSLQTAPPVLCVCLSYP
jgi:hypothetical protein